MRALVGQDLFRRILVVHVIWAGFAGGANPGYADLSADPSVYKKCLDAVFSSYESTLDRHRPFVMLDYYEAKLPVLSGSKERNVAVIDEMSRDEVIDFMRGRLEPFPEFEDRFDEALGRMGRIESWRKGRLYQPDDSSEPYEIPKGCVKLRVATRQYDQVFANMDVINQMNEAQKGLLEVHEAFYYIGTRGNSHEFWAPEVRLAIAEALRLDSGENQLARALSRLYGRELLPKSKVSQLYFYFERALHLSNLVDELSYGPEAVLRKQAQILIPLAERLMGKIISIREKAIPSELDKEVTWKADYWLKDLAKCKRRLNQPFRD